MTLLTLPLKVNLDPLQKDCRDLEKQLEFNHE
jgi:hypothetical protein